MSLLDRACCELEEDALKILLALCDSAQAVAPLAQALDHSVDGLRAQLEIARNLHRHHGSVFRKICLKFQYTTDVVERSGLRQPVQPENKHLLREHVEKF